MDVTAGRAMGGNAVLKEMWEGTVRREPKAAFWMGTSEDTSWGCGWAGVMMILGIVNP